MIAEDDEEEQKLLANMEKEFGIPEGFLIEMIALEKEYLFQLRRRSVIKNIEKMIAEFAED